MKVTIVAALGFLAVPAARAEDVALKGTVCRANSGAVRLIVATDKTIRHPVVVDRSAQVTFEGDRHEVDDIRPGDKIEIFGERAKGGLVSAVRIDVKVRVADTLVNALLGLKPPLVGRFAGREAKTAFFSLNVPGDDYVRVDARPWGYGAVGKLQVGDLIELSGKWTDEREFEASSGRNLTDQEHGGCRKDARRGETKEATASREAAERRFLDGGDIEEKE